MGWKGTVSVGGEKKKPRHHQRTCQKGKRGGVVDAGGKKRKVMIKLGTRTVFEKEKPGRNLREKKKESGQVAQEHNYDAKNGRGEIPF